MFPKIVFFNPKSSVFPYTPSILGKTHHFWKHPYERIPNSTAVASSGRTQVMPLLRPRCKSWSNGEAFFEPRKKPSDTLPKFNIAPESYLPNRKVVFQPAFFRGYVKLRGCSGCLVGILTLPETNIALTNGWLEYDPFLLGFGLFSGARCC